MTKQTNRPLSPHLQVYKPQLTSMMSIMHRATGVALTFGLALIAWWLIAAATSEEAFNTAREFTVSPLGLIMLLGWSFSLYYHLCNGIRHLIWDMGYLFKIKNAYMAGYIVWIVTFALTVLTWVFAYNGGLS